MSQNAVDLWLYWVPGQSNFPQQFWIPCNFHAAAHSFETYTECTHNARTTVPSVAMHCNKYRIRWEFVAIFYAHWMHSIAIAIAHHPFHALMYYYYSAKLYRARAHSVTRCGISMLHSHTIVNTRQSAVRTNVRLLVKEKDFFKH